MKKKLLSFGVFLVLVVALIACRSQDSDLPSDFSYIHKEIPSAKLDIRYFGEHNFVGRPIVGYEKPLAILSSKVTESLKKVQQELNEKGLGIKVFDAYRPQRAVNNFEIWAKDINDTIAKQEFYPDVDKRDLFTLGYIASKSGHTRGSTVDLTIIDLKTNQELDMGSSFDFFGVISHHNTNLITIKQTGNREILRQVMLKNGFKEYAEEWWHYTLINEPFPDSYFDFPVK